MILFALKAMPLLLGKAFRISIYVFNRWKRHQQVVFLAIIQVSAKDMAKPNTDLNCMEALLQPFFICIYEYIYILKYAYKYLHIAYIYIFTYSTINIYVKKIYAEICKKIILVST